MKSSTCYKIAHVDLTLKESLVQKCPNAASDEAVKSMEEQIEQLIDKTIQRGKYEQKHLSNKQGNFIQ